jgi:hypothetical protein
MNGVKEVALVEAVRGEALSVPAVESANVLGMIERLAATPNFDADKLEKLINLQLRMVAHQAKEAFDAAYTDMQSEMPEIQENGRLLVKGVLRSTYAKLEDIQATVRPVLQKHGFAVRHRTEWPADKPGVIRIVGVLSHRQGHSEESAFEAKADASDYRTDIQSMGSTVSYGRRYTLLDLLNITTRGLDKDGAAKPPDPPKTPEGFDRWRDDLFAVADQGWTALAAASEASKPEYREHLKAIDPQALNKLKEKARAADAKRKAEAAR